jgi:hypothetical protein
LPIIPSVSEPTSFLPTLRAVESNVSMAASSVRHASTNCSPREVSAKPPRPRSQSR